MANKRVIHIGPANSIGGMSKVMHTLNSHPPDEWISDIISTHSDGSIISKYKIWKSSFRKIKELIINNEVEIMHIHVTHSVSWWRKRRIIKLCNKNNVSTIVHIHSGRFNDFCNSLMGFTGISVKNILNNNTTTTVVLEKRWLNLLRKWIPEDSIVVNNPSKKINFTEREITGSQIKLLMLARDSKGKGHIFAKKIVRELVNSGRNVKLIMTGKTHITTEEDLEGIVVCKGWITEKEKYDLMLESDFLILPSEFEGSSMSVIEAIMCNLPCIVSPASSETIGNDDLVAPLEDPKDWSERIISLSDKDIYNRILEKLEIQSDKYKIEEIKNKWGEVYEDIYLRSDKSETDKIT